MTPSGTGGTSDGQVGTPLEGHRATALRPRRLVGGDAEVAEVIERLALTPLTTVTGPGGVGKTSLALTVAVAAASQFPDGVFVIWLASLRSAEHIAGEVAAQVGMPSAVAGYVCPFDDAMDRSSPTPPVGQQAPSHGSVVFHPGMATRRGGATT
jgi:hypothetical protein